MKTGSEFTCETGKHILLNKYVASIRNTGKESSLTTTMCPVPVVVVHMTTARRHVKEITKRIGVDARPGRV